MDANERKRLKGICDAAVQQEHQKHCKPINIFECTCGATRRLHNAMTEASRECQAAVPLLLTALEEAEKRADVADEKCRHQVTGAFSTDIGKRTRAVVEAARELLMLHDNPDAQIREMLKREHWDKLRSAFVAFDGESPVAVEGKEADFK